MAFIAVISPSALTGRYDCYSLLNASIGFKFAALLAGIYPKNRPIATDTPKEISTAASVGVAEIPIMVPTTFVAAQPIRMPATPPKELVTAASITNCCKMVPLSALLQIPA